VPFPIHRPRRLRRTPQLRAMVRETSLAAGDLILPLFVAEGAAAPTAVASMPGVARHTIESLCATAKEARSLGIPAILLFGLPLAKDAAASGAWSDTGIVQEAVRTLKRASPDLIVITDVCLCEYTEHGHCGLLQPGAPGGASAVHNDRTLELLARTAVSHARAGADIVAPSDMMDGRVGAIRSALDAAGFDQIPILSYAAKYASAFYGPFRDAADNTPQNGNRRGYQMDPGNALEALREVEADLEEGADLVMVKPGLPCLDILSRVKERFGVPTAAYQVSGEYAMLKAAAANGWIDERAATLEALLALRRGGADLIVSYAAIDAARWLEELEGSDPRPLPTPA